MIGEILNIVKKNLFLIFLIILVSLLSFQLGRITKVADEPIKVERASVQEIFDEQNPNIQINSSGESRGPVNSGREVRVDFRVVVSKNSDKYHFAWCPSVGRIKPENQIWFNSEQEAIAAGYTLAGNCSK